jgi:hypothetical protein
MMWNKWRVQDAEKGGEAGGAGGGAPASGTGAGAAAGAAAGADAGKGAGAAAAAGEGQRVAASGGAVAGTTDWRTSIAGEDKELLAALAEIEDPKTLVQSHTQVAKWRETIAGDNADALKTLERFASPKALYDSYSELRGRMAKGELKNATAYPEKGTPEQQTAWRAENGIPAEPGKYEIKLPAGLEIDDADKPMIEGFQKLAFEKNMPAGAVNDVVNWYFANQQQRLEQANERFETAKTETAATLGEEWGAEYKANMNKIQGVIDSTVPAEQKDLKGLINRAIQTNPHFARHYAAIALQLNPAGTLVPGDRGANEGSVSDAIKKIEKVMQTKRSDYDKDDGMQKQYRTLLGAYEKMTGKSWGR